MIILQLPALDASSDLVSAFTKSRPDGGVVAWYISYEDETWASVQRPNWDAGGIERDFWQHAIRGMIEGGLLHELMPIDHRILSKSLENVGPMKIVYLMALELSSAAPVRPVEYSDSAALHIATNFITALFSEDYGDLSGLHSMAHWSSWFIGDNWDNAWFLRSRKSATALVVAVTDAG